MYAYTLLLSHIMARVLNGRKPECHRRISKWQQQLKSGYSIDAIAALEASKTKNRAQSFLYYRNRILALIDDGDLYA